MGFFRKKKTYDNTKVSKQGKRGAFHSVKRYFKKLVAFAFSVMIFGMIYSGGTTQAIMDLAWRGRISWLNALEQSFIKSLQYGTVKSPELASEMVFMFTHARPITGLINYAVPLAVLYIAYFYLVSFFVDLLDGREGEVYRYWFVALITIAVMGLVFAMMTGYSNFSGADVTFNKTEIVNNLNQTGKTDPIRADLGSAEPSINQSEINVTESKFESGWHIPLIGGLIG